MNPAVIHSINRASVEELAAHLRACDTDFEPTLSTRVDIDAYAQKLLAHAVRLEAWSDGSLVGVAAIYCNDTRAQQSHLSSLSVLPNYRGRGIAAALLARALSNAREAGMHRMSLQVGRSNTSAVALYKNTGFIQEGLADNLVTMTLHLAQSHEHTA